MEGNLGRRLGTQILDQYTYLVQDSNFFGYGSETVPPLEWVFNPQHQCKKTLSHANFLDTEIGTVVVGKLADLVVLEKKLI